MDIGRMIERVTGYLGTDIWKMRREELSARKAFLIRVLRILVLSIRGLRQDRCPLRASALTFYSLLSIVPVVAVLFGVARGFGFGEVLEQKLLTSFAEYEFIVGRIIGYSRRLLDNTQGGLVAVSGLLFLLWTVIKLLGNIESSFNDIWNIRDQRSIVRKITDYTTIMIISPVNFILSSSIIVFITTRVSSLAESETFFGVIGPVLSLILWLLPFVLIWILFGFIYMVMPNTRVRFRSGLAAAVTAGTIYQIVQWIYLEFQIGMARNNAIYGGLAAVPLFLVWLQMSWMIVLLGAEISFAVQNVDTYESPIDSARLSTRCRRALSLLIVHRVVKQFEDGGRPLTADQIASVLNIPIRLVGDMLHDLVASGVFSRVVTDDERDHAYQPARDINTFTVSRIIEMMEKNGCDEIDVEGREKLEDVFRTLDRFSEEIERSDANRPISDS